MATLKLTLKKKWFDMILSGEKKEEYREIKKHWVSRICKKHKGAIGGDLMDNHKMIAHTIKNFDTIELTNGYGLKAPSATLTCIGIDIGEAVPEWSDNWQGNVFRIKVGSIIRTANIK